MQSRRGFAIKPRLPPPSGFGKRGKIGSVLLQYKAKGYELVDSLGNKEAAQLGLEYAEPMNGTFAAYGNQVLCYEYVENPA